MKIHRKALHFYKVYNPPLLFLKIGLKFKYITSTFTVEAITIRSKAQLIQYLELFSTVLKQRNVNTMGEFKSCWGISIQSKGQKLELVSQIVNDKLCQKSNIQKRKKDAMLENYKWTKLDNDHCLEVHRAGVCAHHCGLVIQITTYMSTSLIPPPAILSYQAHPA